MSGESLFDSFYTHFVLRDFMGKIVPGGVVVGAFCYTCSQFHSLAEVESFSKIPFEMWIFLAGVSWIVGLAVQRLGETILRRELCPKQLEAAAERGAKGRMDLIKGGELLRREEERSKVIRESCRNGATSFFVAFFVMSAKQFSPGWRLASLVVTGGILVLMLCVMSYYHTRAGECFRKEATKETIEDAQR